MIGPAGKIAHLIGDHCKASPGFTCPRRFNGCIKGQQVGLLGNALDFTEHPANIAHLGRHPVGHLDQGHGDPRVLDHTLDELAECFRGLGRELMKIRTARLVSRTGDNLHPELLLAMDLVVHVVEAANQRPDRIAENRLSPRDFTLHFPDLLGKLVGNPDDRIAAMRDDRTLGAIYWRHSNTRSTPTSKTRRQQPTAHQNNQREDHTSTPRGRLYCHQHGQYQHRPAGANQHQFALAHLIPLSRPFPCGRPADSVLLADPLPQPLRTPALLPAGSPVRFFD